MNLNLQEQARGAKVDGVRMAVLSNRLSGILRKASNALLRTARSSVINMAKDFSCAITTADGRLVETADGLPIQVVCGPEIVSRYLKEWHPVLRAGDAFLHNSPYHGNTHAADHTIVVPVVDASGTHRLTVQIKAHLADIGNSQPTTMLPTARDVYEEGALIFPCVKVQSNYETIEDIIRMCEMRIRVPEVWHGDFLALLGSARVAESALLELGEEFGWEQIEEHIEQWFDYSERRVRDAIARLTSGTARTETFHDAMPGIAEAPIPVRATVTVDAEAARVTVDLTENVDSLPNGLNMSEASTLSAAYAGVFFGLGGAIATNAGSLRPISVLVREGSAIGIPKLPFSCSLATTGLCGRLIDVVMRSIAEIAAGYGMAESGSVLPIGAGVISGRDARRGDRPFVGLMVTAFSGGPGCCEADGWLTFNYGGTGGMLMRAQSEADELLYPVVIWKDEIIPDTEGAGRRRGAPSVHFEWAPARHAVTVIWASDGQVHAAAGARGGGPGAGCNQFLRDTDGRLVNLPQFGRQDVLPGQRIVSYCTAGGGYGAAFEREPDRVLADFQEGWISIERARAAYGVVIGTDLKIDVEATAALRG